MVEMDCWETGLVYGWKESRTSKSSLAGKFVLIILLAGKETKVIDGNLLIRDVLLEGGNSYFFSQQV